MRILIALLLLAVPGLQAFSATVYRWVDDKGQVHYTDVPREGATPLELSGRPAATLPAPVLLPAPAAREEDAAQDEGQSGYRSLSITSPAPEQTFWNTQGQLDVQVRLEPRLQPGDSLTIFLDGNPVQVVREARNTIRLTQVFRGEHRVSAEVQDARGRSLVRSEPVRFFVQQTSVLSPNRPAAP